MLKAGASYETVFGYLTAATGVKEEEEMQRKKEQAENDPDRLDANMFSKQNDQNQEDDDFNKGDDK